MRKKFHIYKGYFVPLGLIVIPGLYAGALLGASILVAMLLIFGITLPIFETLQIYKKILQLLVPAEWGLIALYVTLTIIEHNNWKIKFTIGCVVLILIMQTTWLLPSLNYEIELLKDSNLLFLLSSHFVGYIVYDILKIILLLALSYESFYSALKHVRMQRFAL